MVLGLTGKYCAGKDAVAEILGRRGFMIIDVDAVGHEVLHERRDEVVAAFGASIERSDGAIDRGALAAIVFADRAALARLQAIVHPAMAERVRARVKEETGRGADVVINAAVLHRMGLDRICDAVVFVQARAWRRLARALRRDGLALRQAFRRMASQRDLVPRRNSGPTKGRYSGPTKGKNNGAGVDTYSVRNDRGTARSLERSVVALLERLQARQAEAWRSRRSSG